MKSIKPFLECFIILAIIFCGSAFCQSGGYKAIYSGIPWFDNNRNTVSAHGANIIKDNDRFYLFGERHSDTSNAFAGFNCYSSADLYNWRFESVALPLQPSGKLGPRRVGERPKVMECPGTGEYIMYMHVDTLGYTDQFLGYAIAQKITGPYIFKGPLLFNNKPIKKWDMGVFQDTDGAGYVLLHGGDIYKLSEDYKTISLHINKAMVKGFESPALFKKDSIYYLLGSGLTGWERNDNDYYTATSLAGPWTKRGLFAPEGTLTWNAQTSFVLPIVGSEKTAFMFMGDRWSFPRQATAATYVWQPLQVDGHKLSLPVFAEAWSINLKTGAYDTTNLPHKIIPAASKQINYLGTWRPDSLGIKTADKKAASFSVKIKGTQLGFYGLARPDGGYAKIVIHNSKGRIVLTSFVDMYSKYPALLLKFLSPELPRDTYTMRVLVLQENWYWVEKSGRKSGSKGYSVSLDRIIYK